MPLKPFEFLEQFIMGFSNKFNPISDKVLFPWVKFYFAGKSDNLISFSKVKFAHLFCDLYTFPALLTKEMKKKNFQKSQVK